ncbi:hypothetical protein J6590_018211 [Homalodisca vitripennis]|nr:hypothetical protein J6590_018211 [Homalodisca vitripennis]
MGEPEVLRVPGSPQLEARRVRGSWRDYLDPVSPDWDPDCACLSDSSEFEPFSEDELSDMDLALFEPGPPSDSRALCCAQCRSQRYAARRLAIPPANLYMLTQSPQNDYSYTTAPESNPSLRDLNDSRVREKALCEADQELCRILSTTVTVSVSWSTRTAVYMANKHISCGYRKCGSRPSVSDMLIILCLIHSFRLKEAGASAEAWTGDEVVLVTEARLGPPMTGPL